MSEPSIEQLEREVEAARARLAGDLAVIRSPATYAQFTSELKDEAVDLKNSLVDKAKASVQSTFDNLIDDVKARAAANPAAALAIGAGIAWRMIRHPPIATALVGAGLYSLFRTAPTRVNGSGDYLTQAKSRLGEQAAGFAGAVKDRAVEMGEAAVAKAGELASDAVDRASAMGESAKDKVAELAGSVKQGAQEWTSEGFAVDDIRSSAAAAQRTVARAGAAAEDWARPVQEMIEDPQSRDKLLLGAAGVAVAAALGIACQRRLSEPADAE
ncbi:MAG: hypothetical protein K2Y71_15290 [Xanthobacteraceae bacterium]|nr:hypothetical protein [Xanthobacteraceae bacterium]